MPDGLPAMRWVGTLVLATTAAGAVLGGCDGPREESAPRVSINGVTWFVDVAMTVEQRRQGLAGRPHLADNVGMLFLFPKERPQAFWMEGCLIDLDIAFIDSDRRVINTTTMTAEPDRRGRRSYYSKGPCRYVLEVAAGRLAAAGVRPGDRVTFLGDIPDASKADPSP